MIWMFNSWLLILFFGFFLSHDAGATKTSDECLSDFKEILSQAIENAEQTVQKNRAARIEWALQQTKRPKSEDFLPSEIRKMKKAASELSSEGRTSESKSVLARIEKQEKLYEIRQSKRLTLSIEEQKLVSDRILLTPKAKKELEHLPANVVEIIEKKYLLEIAKDPHRFGIPMRPPMADHFKVRVRFNNNEYRILYTLEGGKANIKAIGSREGIYQGL